MKERKEVKMIYPVDVPNVNGNIYPREVVREALKEYQKLIDQKRAIGTCGQDYEDIHTGAIDLMNVTHLVTNVQEVKEGFEVTMKPIYIHKNHPIAIDDLITEIPNHIYLGIRGNGIVENKVVTSLTIWSFDVLL